MQRYDPKYGDLTVPSTLMRCGGKWLGALRARMQMMFLNGDMVTFGSRDELQPAASVLDVEKLGAEAAAAVYAEVFSDPAVASAPDLLEACKMFVDACENAPSKTAAAVRMARAAIAKAEDK